MKRQIGGGPMSLPGKPIAKQPSGRPEEGNSEPRRRKRKLEGGKKKEKERKKYERNLKEVA